jgi:hypothetical protein
VSWIIAAQFVLAAAAGAAILLVRQIVARQEAKAARQRSWTASAQLGPSAASSWSS